MNCRCSDEPAGVVTTTRNVRGTASAEIVSVAVRLVSLSTLTLVTGGWGSVATTSTLVFCGMNFVPVRMTSTFVPGSPLDGLIAASVGAAGLAALFGGATTDGFEGVVTVWPHAQASADNAIAKSLFDTSAPLRNVDAAIVQQQSNELPPCSPGMVSGLSPRCQRLTASRLGEQREVDEPRDGIPKSSAGG